ncbi:uncharacterized protein LOC116619656 [Nematostella vectensis]|uniref:uncharacterized protein LOC116619656 n=1 Tax=Nematostella vectensis TaxID=45351 RepID=UPI0020778684|nr:uncharacterized protein LOC116619656 [Nematostella vectensis]
MATPVADANPIARRFPFFGHHYFNPQFVSYEETGEPAVLYSNAVYFTVSRDGTHYFHQTYSGQFLTAQPPVVAPAVAMVPPEPQVTHAPTPYEDCGNDCSDYGDQNVEYTPTTEPLTDYKWDDSKCHLPVKPCMNPWRTFYSPPPPPRPHSRFHRSRHRRTRRDVRSTVVPMFPEVFGMDNKEEMHRGRSN